MGSGPQLTLPECESLLTIHRRPVVLPSGEMANVLEPPLQWCLPNSGTRERLIAHAPVPAVANPGLSPYLHHCPRPEERT